MAWCKPFFSSSFLLSSFLLKKKNKFSVYYMAPINRFTKDVGSKLCKLFLRSIEQYSHEYVQHILTYTLLLDKLLHKDLHPNCYFQNRNTILSQFY